MLSIDDEVFFPRGKINLIIGPTGAGKTSLLMALLGEMHYIPQGPDSLVNLPRGGGVAYAAQESWVQSDTIKVCSCHSKGPVRANLLCRTTLSSVRPSTRFGTIRVRSSISCSSTAYSSPSIVLDQCALRRDLELFDAGDETEVGEKGLTLR